MQTKYSFFTSKARGLTSASADNISMIAMNTNIEGGGGREKLHLMILKSQTSLFWVFLCQCLSSPFRFIVLVRTMGQLSAHQIRPAWRGRFLGPGTLPLFSCVSSRGSQREQHTYFFIQKMCLTPTDTWRLMTISMQNYIVAFYSALR